MTLKASYDPEGDSLVVTNGEKVAVVENHAVSPGTLCYRTTKDGYGIAGFMVIGARGILPLHEGEKYDAAGDVLVLGEVPERAYAVVVADDLSFYYPDAVSSDSYRGPQAIVVRNASLHLGAVSDEVAALPPGEPYDQEAPVEFPF